MTRKIVPECPAVPQALNPLHSRDVFYGYDVLDLQTFARFDSTGGEGLLN